MANADVKNEAIRSTLVTAGLVIEAPVLDEVVDALGAELRQMNRFRAIHRSLNEPDTAYAIRESDLDLVREVGVVAAAFAAGLPNPASVIVGLLVFLLRYRRKRIRLTAEQACVLKVLSDSKSHGATICQLVDRLPALRFFTTDQVFSILTSLKGARQSDGNLVALVSEVEGYWSAVDV